MDAAITSWHYVQLIHMNLLLFPGIDLFDYLAIIYLLMFLAAPPFSF